jgi:nucleoside transporter
MAQPGAATGSFVAPRLALGTRLSLSVMMFLQFAIWGAWFVVFFLYLTKKKFPDEQASALMGNMALGAIFSTVFAGYIADRFLASERMMGVLHLVGAALLYWMAQIQDPKQFWTLFGVSLAYALVYNPTLALSNSIAFSHVPNATRDFPGIRVLGTLGWIVAGFAIDMLPRGQAETAADTNQPLLLAAGLSAVLGVYSFFLPHTPPAGKEGDVVPFVKALGLFKDFSFAVFFTVSLIITTVLAFYYTVMSAYLQQAAAVKDIGSTMAIGQIAELVLLPFLPIFLYRFGMKWVLALGMLAWGVRYAFFSFGGPAGLPFALVIAGVALHGVCFDFFFAAGFIHVDNEAPREIRASGQALFSFLTYGVGMWLGALLCGKVLTFFSERLLTEDQGWITNVDWQHFWIVPSAGVLLSLMVFVLFFHSRPQATLARPELLEGEVALPVSGEAGISPSLSGETEITPSTGG